MSDQKIRLNKLKIQKENLEKEYKRFISILFVHLMSDNSGLPTETITVKGRKEEVQVLSLTV